MICAPDPQRPTAAELETRPGPCRPHIGCTGLRRPAVLLFVYMLAAATRAGAGGPTPSAAISSTLPPVPPVATSASLPPQTQSGTASTTPSPNPPPVLGIGTPAHGDPLYDTSAWYDDTTGLITVRGAVTHVPRPLINSGNYQIVLDGQFMASGVFADAAQREISFMGETPARATPTWAMRTVLAELVDTTTTQVVARGYVDYFDLRVADEASPRAGYGPISGMAVQLTDSGVGRSVIDDRATSLEVPHLASLPYPSLADFNDALHSTARALPSDAGPTKLGACINLADAAALEPGLTGTPEYLALYGVATGYYLAYEAFEESGACTGLGAVLGAANPFLGTIALLGCEVAMQSYCVKALPRAEDFELCVDELQADPSALGIEQVDEVSLAFADSGGTDGARIAAGYGVAGVTGTLDGLVRRLSYRWAGSSCSAPPPETQISDSRLRDGGWLQDFTTCEDIAIEAPRAATGETTQAEFRISAAPQDREALQVSLEVPGELSLVDPEVRAENGICGQDFLVDATEALAQGYQDRFEDTLNEVWNGVGTSNHQTQALEVLLSRLELGLPGHPGYGLDASLQVPLASAPVAGTQLVWDTQVLELKDGKEVVPVGDTYFLHPAFPAPFFEDAVNGGGEHIDMSFTITTGYLNQLLHIQGRDLLHLSYRPTWDELVAVGVSAPPGSAGRDIAILDGKTLAQIDPSFAILGATEVAIEIDATLDPIVWMHPDPPSFLEDPVTGFPLGYGISGVQIRFVETGPGATATTGAREWLRLRLGFLDPDIGLIMGLVHPNLIALNMLHDDWGLAVEASLFNGCPMVPHGLWEPPVSCERTLEQALLPLFKNLLRPRFVAMLSGIQSPQVFRAGGGNAVSFDVERHWKANQNITYYGDIPDY